jgi:hypothetical protein
LHLGITFRLHRGIIGQVCGRTWLCRSLVDQLFEPIAEHTPPLFRQASNVSYIYRNGHWNEIFWILDPDCIGFVIPEISYLSV